MPRIENPQDPKLLPAGTNVAFAGRLASMRHADAAELLRQNSLVVVNLRDPSVQAVVVAETGSPFQDLLKHAADAGYLNRRQVEKAKLGELAIIPESQLWQELGIVKLGNLGNEGMFTPAMLANLVDMPIAVIRRWRRRGLIRPIKEVRRLPYFDFQEAAIARQLASLVASGISPNQIERQLESLGRRVPHVQRPLAQLSVLVEGRRLLLRSDEGLLDDAGQYRFDFESDFESDSAVPLPLAAAQDAGCAEAGPESQIAQAENLEDEGALVEALECYRAAIAAGGPAAEISFAMAELLYQMGELTAARERYYAALEYDEDYVEARANLGCVLLELNEKNLAAAAFEGALSSHPEYPDALYHLARTLDELSRSDEAEGHWQAFLDLAPESPWAEEARTRLEDKRQQAQ